MCRVVGIELEVVEDGPAEHVGQEHVERDGRRLELARQGQRRLRRASATMPLNPRSRARPEQHARVVRVVLDDEQHVVARRDGLAVVGEHFGLAA